MTQITLPTYAKLSQALDKTNLKLHASQVHGLISGLLCGNPMNHAPWEELVTGGKNKGKSHELLQLLYDGTAKQLADLLFEFQMILPADSAELRLRAEALTLWCQGFLTGLKLAELSITDREPSEITEAINDLIEIAKMNYEDVVESEEDEVAYVELVEFVRMAVIMIYQDLRSSEQSQKISHSSTQLH